MKRYFITILIMCFVFPVHAISSYKASYDLYAKTDLGNINLGTAEYELIVSNNTYFFTSNAKTNKMWSALYDYSIDEMSIGLIKDKALIGDYYKISENEGNLTNNNYEIQMYPNEGYVSLNNEVLVNGFTKSNLKELSDSELIINAIGSGNRDEIKFTGSQALDYDIPSYEKDLANREELIEAFEIFTKSGLEKLSDRELILKAINSGIANKIEFGGIKALDPTVPSYEKEVANREELIEVLAESSVSILAPPLMVNDLKFYIVDTTDTDDFIRADDGSIYYPNKIRYKSNDKVKVDAVAFAKYNPYSLGKYDNLNNIKLFEDFVRYLQLNKVDVTLFLPPYNPITYDLLLESNKYNIILTAEKYLINFAKLNDLDLKGSYNPHKYELSNEDFFDGVHGRDRVFKKIFQPVL